MHTLPRYPTMSNKPDLPIYRASYDLMLLLVSKIKHYPVHLRAPLGDRFIDTSIELLSNITKANKQLHKGSFIPLITDKADLLQLLNRASKDLQVISIETYAEIAVLIDSILAQAHGWQRSLK